MPIRFYNSLTRKKEVFKPIENGKVKLYTCGPTVYDAAHIGNFRAFMFEDLLKRYLQFKGFKVFHVMNITDVDDKTIKRSIDENIPVKDLTNKYSGRFFEDLKKLKIIPADMFPRATDHIPSIIKMIRSLLEKNHAYRTKDGSVYFAIDTYQNYGRLTQLDFSRQRSTARVSTDEYSKDNPQDFVLWKSWKAEDGEVFWDSPWGKGRPGWHIECSVMSIEYLGNHFDLHCGGVDNIFPHHENEIAQSVCATGAPFVNVWMHCEYLLVDGSKMSKSLGNVYQISDLFNAGFTSEMIRYVLLSTHYRSKLNFSLKKKHEAQQIIQRVIDIMDRLILFAGEEEPNNNLPDEYELFEKALDNDLDTPNALAIFFDWIRRLNKRLDIHELSKAEAKAGINFIRRFNSVFDFLPPKTSVPDEILRLIEARQQARKQKNWSRADEIRDKIIKMGWIIEDTPEGPKCKRQNLR